MDRFRNTVTLVNNAQSQKRLTVCTDYAIVECGRVSKKTRMSPTAIAYSNWSCAHLIHGIFLISGRTFGREVSSRERVA